MKAALFPLAVLLACVLALFLGGCTGLHDVEWTAHGIYHGAPLIGQRNPDPAPAVPVAPAPPGV